MGTKYEGAEPPLSKVGGGGGVGAKQDKSCGVKSGRTGEVYRKLAAISSCCFHSKRWAQVGDSDI